MKRKRDEKKVVIISEGEIQRKRIAFKDYVKGKEYVELLVSWIFLPLKFPSYGLLLSDGNDEYRISYSVKSEVMDKVFATFGLKVGMDYYGKVLILKKEGGRVTIEEGKDDALYEWVSGKGWRLAFEDKDDIPF